MKKNNASIGSDVLESVILTYPELNIVWLLTGKGEMLNMSQANDERVHHNLTFKQQQFIEQIVDAKIKERYDYDRKELLNEVSKEISRNKKSTKK